MNKILLSHLPDKAGIYLFKNQKEEIIYVGKAINIRKRVQSYFQKNLNDPKTVTLVAQVVKVDFIQTISEFDALLLEATLIKKYRPKYNVIWRDDKHPLYIKITARETFPRILTVRRETEKKAVYFGPFPNGFAARTVLRELRRIFPYCAQSRIGRRACFYSHIGLCDPCPSVVVRLPKDQYDKEKRRYRTNIWRIKRVLSGKTLTVLHELEKEMHKAAASQEFEKAVTFRDQAQKLRYVTQQHFSAYSYLANTSLVRDEKKHELTSLRQFFISLNAKSPLAFTVPEKLARIECFDISNISGSGASGSMVTFTDGEVDKAWYRHFRIRTSASPNDTKMMAEVLRRRFQHDDWPQPDLVLVDGGKGQVSVAMQVLGEHNLVIATAGLAKRLEQLVVGVREPVVDSSSGRFRVSRLSPGTAEFHLVTRIRDEAHRFALAYHRKLRAKLSLMV